VWVGEGQVDGARPVGSCEWEPGVDAWGVVESKAQICGSIKVGGGLVLFFRGEEPGRVGCCIVDVEVACDQVGVVEDLKGGLGGNCVGVRGKWYGV